jgi:hypothetical protein
MDILVEVHIFEVADGEKFVAVEADRLELSFVVVFELLLGAPVAIVGLLAAFMVVSLRCWTVDLIA